METQKKLPAQTKSILNGDFDNATYEGFDDNDETPERGLNDED